MPNREAPLRARKRNRLRRPGWERHARAPSWLEVLFSVVFLAWMSVTASSGREFHSLDGGGYTFVGEGWDS